MTLYLRVTNDKYEFPVIITDTAEEMAKLCNVKVNTIYSNLSKSRAKGYNSTYKRVIISEDEDEDLYI